MPSKIAEWLDKEDATEATIILSFLEFQKEIRRINNIRQEIGINKVTYMDGVPCYEYICNDGSAFMVDLTTGLVKEPKQ